MSTKVKVDELTIEGVVYVPKDSISKEVFEINKEKSPWIIGTNYLVRTVTMIQLGKLTNITDKELVLSSACWVADTGRFNEALEKGTLNEVELFQRDVIVSRGAIVDATEWIADLPTKSK